MGAPGANAWVTIVYRLLDQYKEKEWDYSKCPNEIARVNHLIQCTTDKDLKQKKRNPMKPKQIQAVFDFATVFHGDHEAMLQLDGETIKEIRSKTKPMKPGAQLDPFCQKYLEVSKNGAFAEEAFNALKVLLKVCRLPKHRGVGVHDMGAIKLACLHLLERQNAEQAGISGGNLDDLALILAKISGNANGRRLSSRSPQTPFEKLCQDTQE